MKIYRYLRTIWLMGAASLAIVLLNMLEAVLDISSIVLDAAATVISLIVGCVTIWALGKLSGESKRLNRAFFCQCFYVALSLLAFVLAYVGAGIEMLAVFSVLLVLVSSIFSIVSDFQLYWALDERVVTCGYAFPARRIRWCFYLPLVGVLLSSAVETAQIASQLNAGQEVTELAFSSTGTAVLFLCQLGALLLLARYCIAVERFEADNVQ